MSKRGAEFQMSKDGTTFNGDGRGSDNGESPRQATAAQLAKRRIAPLKGRKAHTGGASSSFSSNTGNQPSFGGFGTSSAPAVQSAQSFPPSSSNANENIQAPFSTSFGGFGSGSQQPSNIFGASTGGFNPQPPSGGFNFNAGNSNNPFATKLATETNGTPVSNGFGGSIFSFANNTQSQSQAPSLFSQPASSAAPASGTPSFNFGATTPSFGQSLAQNGASTATGPTTSAPAFSFNASTSVFGKQDDKPSETPATKTLTFSFGGITPSFGQSTTQSGSSNTPAVSAASTPSFNFGGTSTSNAPSLFSSSFQKPAETSSAAPSPGPFSFLNSTSTPAQAPAASTTTDVEQVPSNPFAALNKASAPPTPSATATKDQSDASAVTPAATAQKPADQPFAGLGNAPKPTEDTPRRNPFANLPMPSKDKTPAPSTSEKPSTPANNHFAGLPAKANTPAAPQGEDKPKGSPIAPTTSSAAPKSTNSLFQPSTPSQPSGSTPSPFAPKAPATTSKAPSTAFGTTSSAPKVPATTSKVPSGPGAFTPSTAFGSQSSAGSSLFSKATAPPASNTQLTNGASTFAGPPSRKLAPAEQPTQANNKGAMVVSPMDTDGDMPPPNGADNNDKSSYKASMAFKGLNTSFRKHLKGQPLDADWSEVMQYYMRRAQEIYVNAEVHSNELVGTDNVGDKRKPNDDDSESSAPKRIKGNEHPSHEDSSDKAGPSQQPKPNQSSKTAPSASTSATMNLFQSIVGSDQSSKSTSQGFSGFKPTISSGASTPNLFGDKVGTTTTTSEKPAAPSGFQVPQFGPAGGAPVNFMAQFGAQAKKTEEEMAAAAKKKAKDEEFDSEDDNEEEWEAQYAERIRKKKEGLEKAKSSGGFQFSATKSKDQSKEQSKTDSQAKLAPPSTSLFGSSRSPSPVPGGSSVFATPGGSESSANKSTNIFAHLSEAESGGEGKGSAEDDEDESDAENNKEGASEQQTESSSDAPKQTPAPSGTSTPRSLFDRIEKDKDGNPVRETPKAPSFLSNSQFNIIGSGTGTPGDNTWKANSPIKFGTSTSGTGGTPLFNFTPASPSKPSGDKSKSDDASKDKQAPSSNPFQLDSSWDKATKTTKNVGFSFGGSLGKPGTSSLAPSSALTSGLTSGFTSRATTPGVSDNETSAAESTAEAEAYNDPQNDLTALTDAEKRDEEILFECPKAKALRHNSQTKKWDNLGLGPVRVLKNKSSGVVRVLQRIAPSGKVVLNNRLLSKMEYKSPQQKAAQLILPDSDGKLFTCLVKFGQDKDAQRLVEVCEENKGSN